MRIVSWNINGLRSLLKFLSHTPPDPKLYPAPSIQSNSSKLTASNSPLTPLFQALNADIICFQETKGSDKSSFEEHEAKTKQSIQVPGYDHYFSFSKKRKGWSGVATYVRQGITVKAQEGFGHAEFDDEGRCIMTDHGDFILFNVYFVNGGTGPDRLDYKMKFYNAFQQTCQEYLNQGRQVIVVGDVNTAHTPMDVHDPVRFAKKTGFLPQEREWVTLFLNSGFIDAFRHLHPTEISYTFWDMRTRKKQSNEGWRIDYALVSKGLESFIQQCLHIPNQMGSDHCPVILDMNITPTALFPSPHFVLAKQAPAPLQSFFKPLASPGDQAVAVTKQVTESTSKKRPTIDSYFVKLDNNAQKKTRIKE